MIMRFGSMPTTWSIRRSGKSCEVLFSGLGRPSVGNTTGAMSAVTPPLTRPAGDLSPGRGDDDRPGEANSKCADPPSLGVGLLTPPTPPGPPFARGKGFARRGC